MDPQMPITNPMPIEPVSTPVQIPETRPKFPFIYFVLLLLSLGLLASTAFLYYQNTQLKNILASYQTPVVSSTPAATADPTASWKTYTDPKGKFSFKYPTDWKLNSNGADHQILDKIDTTQPKVGFPGGSERDASYEIDISNPLPSDGIVIPNNAEKNSVDGVAGSRYTEGCGGCSGASTFVVVKNNNQIFIFSYGAQAHPETHIKYIETFDQILSTFKFLEVSPTTSMQTGYITSITPSGDFYTFTIKLLNGQVVSLPTDFPTDTNPKVTLQTYSAGVNGMPNLIENVTFSQFLLAFNTTSEKWTKTPFVIETSNGTITKITEQYIP